MKKIHIQVLLISLTVIFLGVVAFYYWQGLEAPKFSNNRVVENKKIITEKIVSESPPLFDESDNSVTPSDERDIVEEIIIEEEDTQEDEKTQLTSKNIIENDFAEIDDNIENRLPTFPIDIYSDSSIQKFVGSEVSFSDVSYIPEDLVSLSGSYIIDAKGNGQMRREALVAFESLSESFYAEFSEKIVVVSTYRSYVYQKGIKDRGCPDNLCAKAGYSEHQSGLGIDLWEATTNTQFLGKIDLKNYYEWLMENAPLYGYHNSYQKGKAIDGYDIEPWHWRYVGKELAIYLSQNNLTFTEFYNLQMLNER